MEGKISFFFFLFSPPAELVLEQIYTWELATKNPTTPLCFARWITVMTCLPFDVWHHGTNKVWTFLWNERQFWCCHFHVNSVSEWKCFLASKWAAKPRFYQDALSCVCCRQMGRSPGCLLALITARSASALRRVRTEKGVSWRAVRVLLCASHTTGLGVRRARQGLPWVGHRPSPRGLMPSPPVLCPCHLSASGIPEDSFN